MNFVDRTGHPSMPELTWQYGYAYFCESVSQEATQAVSQGQKEREDRLSGRLWPWCSPFLLCCCSCYRWLCLSVCDWAGLLAGAILVCLISYFRFVKR